MEAPAPLKPPEITSPLKSEPQALIFNTNRETTLFLKQVRSELELTDFMALTVPVDLVFVQNKLKCSQVKSSLNESSYRWRFNLRVEAVPCSM
jgi:hypothetical protein